MPLDLPNLDNRSYADLVEEARRLITVYDPEWTNHNPSDPGITLLELFAYLTEMLLYRLDRVTAENRRKFLKLLNGPGWKPGADLTADIHETVLSVRARERAVTAADFERLATNDFNTWLKAWQRAEQEHAGLEEWWRMTQLDDSSPDNRPSSVPEVARAACVPARNLERGTEAERADDAPGHASLMVLPRDAGAPQPPEALRAALWGYLDPRRILTMRHHVVGPYYTPIRAEVVIATAAGADAGLVRDRVVERLARFLDPRTGGTVKTGWPFGRDVYVSELYEQIEAVEGVDYISDLMLFSACRPEDIRCAAATPVWHTEGDLIGMALERHHLPLARFDAAGIVIAPSANFVPVQLAVTLTAGGATGPAALKRLAKVAVRDFFHPLRLGPGPGTKTATDLLLVHLQTALEGVSGVVAATLDLKADPARLLVSGGEVTGLHLEAGEVVNWRTQVVVQTR